VAVAVVLVAEVLMVAAARGATAQLGKLVVAMVLLMTMVAFGSAYQAASLVAHLVVCKVAARVDCLEVALAAPHLV